MFGQATLLLMLLTAPDSLAWVEWKQNGTSAITEEQAQKRLIMGSLIIAFAFLFGIVLLHVCLGWIAGRPAATKRARAQVALENKA